MVEPAGRARSGSERIADGRVDVGAEAFDAPPKGTQLPVLNSDCKVSMDCGSIEWAPLVGGADGTRLPGVASEVVDAAWVQMSAARAAARFPEQVQRAESLYSGVAGGVVAVREIDRVRRQISGSQAREVAHVGAGSARACTRLGLFDGLTGIAYAMAMPGACGDIGSVETLLRDRLIKERSVIPWDLCRGLVGMGVYGAIGYPDERAVDLIELVVDEMARRAHCTRAGITWRQDDDPRCSGARRSQVDLGVAHGTAGAVGMLAWLLGVGCQSPHSRR